MMAPCGLNLLGHNTYDQHKPANDEVADLTRELPSL